MKNIKQLLIIILLLGFFEEAAAQTFTKPQPGPNGEVVTTEILTSDCINYEYAFYLDGVKSEWLTIQLQSSQPNPNDCQFNYTGFGCDSIGGGNPNPCNYFPAPAYHYDNPFWSINGEWDPGDWEGFGLGGTGHIPIDYGPNGQVTWREHLEHLFIVDSAVVINSFTYARSCNNQGVNVNFFEPYDLGCKTISSVTTSYQSGDFFPCGCTDVLGTINYTDGSTYDFHFEVRVSCSSVPTVVIQDALQLPSIGSNAVNSEVLTINDCGIVSKTDISTLDMDSDPQNEIQDISLNGSDLTISNGSTVTLPSSTELIDLDGDTYVKVENTPDIDQILFGMEGTDYFEIKRINGNPIFSVLNSNNTAFGEGAGLSLNTGNDNTFYGELAGKSVLNGSENTAIGNEALISIVNTTSNTAIGHHALKDLGLGNPTSSEARRNVGVGAFALSTSTLGEGNVGVGYQAMGSATSDFNVAIGFNALQNAIGNSNVSVGAKSGISNTTGTNNVFIGHDSGGENEIGINNTLVGQGAGFNTDASYNTYIGRWAGLQNFGGTCNSSLGYGAGSANGQANLVNTTAIGYEARATTSNQVRVGDDNVTAIGGIVNWSMLSDGRFKKNIEEDVKGLEFINKLRPVTYNLNSEALKSFRKSETTGISNSEEIDKIKFSGFIAQEVEEAANFVNYEFSGVQLPKNESDNYSLKYAEFVVPLVKSVQELSEENKELKTQNEELQIKLEEILKRLTKLEE